MSWIPCPRGFVPPAARVTGISIGCRAVSASQRAPRVFIRLAPDVLAVLGSDPKGLVVVSFGAPGTAHAGQVLLAPAAPGDRDTRRLIKDNQKAVSYTYHIDLAAHWLPPKTTVHIEPVTRWSRDPEVAGAVTFAAPGWLLKGYVEWLRTMHGGQVA